MDVSLDLKTILITSASFNIAIILIMGHTALTRRVYPGFGLWIAGFVLNVVGQFSLAHYPYQQDSLILAAGSSLILGLPILGWFGLRQFMGLRIRAYEVISTLGGSAILVSLSRVMSDDLLIQTGTVALISVVLALMCLRDTRRHLPELIVGDYFLLRFAIFLGIATVAGRFFILMSYPELAKTTAVEHPANAITVLVLTATRLLFMSAFIMLTQQRLEKEYQFSQQQLAAKTEELRQLNESLIIDSRQDALTGLANRRRFDEVIDFEWRRHIREKIPLSILMVDVDHFKLFNDNYGHTAGDDCLRAITKAFKAPTNRPTDLPCRYGGEEFAVILPNTDSAGACEVARRIKQQIDELKYPHPVSPVAKVITVSIGVHTAEPRLGQDPEELIGQADEALYHAKLRGRNHISVRADLDSAPV